MHQPNGLYPELKKNSNKHTVLNLVRFTPGGISRADIARHLGLSRAAITAIVNDLLVNELVRETVDGPVTGGRRPKMLGINPNGGYVIGVDIGATHLGLLLTNLAAQVLYEIEIPFQVSLGPEVCLAKIDDLLRELLSKADLTLDHVDAIGVGVPGPVVEEAGAVIAPPIMPGWDHFPIQTHLHKLWNCPISLNNDAELGAIGEWAYGAGRGEDHLLYIKVGYGVGAGLLIEGNIYRGATGSAGEIGHITIVDQGPLCTCGNYGCLEALAGGRAIAERAQLAVKNSNGRRTQLSQIDPIESISSYDVTSAARMGDLKAQEIIAEAGNYLGIAIVNLINVVNPGMIVIGGGVAQNGDLFLEPIRRSANERSLPAAVQNLRITAATLERRSTSMGAIVQALTISLSKKSNQ
ncbi:MAG: ROK family transcriptional regulator [Chloroflexi bacterium]|nr:ROK family transcriptional regulator [Chloroflexota bacterium]